MQEALADDIEVMDFGTEAAEAGKATIDGFISSANAMLPQIQAVYGWLGQAAKNALSPGGSAGGGNGYDGTTYIRAYAEGTRYAQEGAALVGEYGPELVYMRGGETVLTAKQTSAVLSRGGGGSGGARPIQLSPTYNISGSANAEELEAVLRAHDEGLRAMVLEVIEEAEADSARRAYW